MFYTNGKKKHRVPKVDREFDVYLTVVLCTMDLIRSSLCLGYPASDLVAKITLLAIRS